MSATTAPVAQGDESGDVHLAKQVLAGEKEAKDALRKIVAQLNGPVFRQAGSHSVTDEEAEDLAQDTFLWLVERRLALFEGFLYRVEHPLPDLPKPSLIGYLLGATEKHLIDLVRRKLRDTNRTSDNSPWLKRVYADRKLRDTPQDGFNMVVFRQDVQRVLAELPSDQERALRLYAAGFRYEDIAAITGRRLGTISAWIAKAREHLRRRLPEWRDYV